MIIEGLLAAFFVFVNYVVNLLPENNQVINYGIGGIMGILGFAFRYFPIGLFTFAMMNISFWLSIQFVWAVIEWIYKKIPGVN